MSGMSDKEFERLAVLHTMGALSPEEAERFRAEREARGQSGEQLVEGVEQAIRSTGTRVSGASERADLAAVTRPLPSRKRGRWIAAVVVLALALVGALAWAIVLRDRNDTLAGERDLALQAVDSLGREAATRDSALAGLPRPADLTPILGSPDLRVVDLAGEAGATGRLLASPNGAILVARGLPFEEETYRLWRVTARGPEPVAELGPAPQGFLFTVFSDDTFLEDATAVRVVPAGQDATSPALEGPVPR